MRCKYDRNKNDMPKISEKDLLYIAGAIDAGSSMKMMRRFVKMHNHLQYVPYLCFYSINATWVPIFNSLVNDSCNKFVYRKPEQRNWRGRIVISAQPLSDLIQQVLPYLRDPFNIKMLSKMKELRDTFMKDPTFYNKANQIPDVVYEKREQIYQEFMKLMREKKEKSIEKQI